MKKILLSIFALVILAGCSPETEEIPAVEFGDSVDLTHLFAQVCITQNGPCKNLSCDLAGDTYGCYENIADRNNNCSSIKAKDDVISRYKICGMESKEMAEEYSIFNYGQSLELLEMGGTPAEFQKKIEEETATVENGGTSDFLTTMMAVAGGSILGGMISNALFHSNSAIPPRSVQTQKEEPFDKKKLESTKKSTSNNASKIKDSISKTKQKSQNNIKRAAAKKAAAKKAAQKKATQKKRSPRKSSFRRRR